MSAREQEIFDQKAVTYDAEFSDSLVGSTQRKQVHDFLRSYLKEKSGLNILELNCGTGEDIGLLSEYGKVTASDISISMLEAAKKKHPGIPFKQIDLNQPLPKEEKYDLVFSNFGGLNCITEERLQLLDAELKEILRPGGSLILVFISKWSLLEFLYFICRLKFRKAFRRFKGVSDYHKIPIYYYSQSATEHIFQSFKLNRKLGIGKIFAGEYMNKWAPKLGLKEPCVSRPTWLFGADHILFNFIRR